MKQNDAYLEKLQTHNEEQELLKPHYIRVAVFKMLVAWPVLWISVWIYGWNAVLFWTLVKIAKWLYMAPKWQSAGGIKQYYINKEIAL